MRGSLMSETRDSTLPHKSVELVETDSEDSFTAFKINNELGQTIGTFDIDVDDSKKEAWVVNVVIEDEDNRDIGYGTLAYTKLLSHFKDLGIKIKSYAIFWDPRAESIWEKMVEEGKAKANDDGSYESL